MKRLLWALVFIACALPSESVPVDTTFTLPYGESVQVTAPTGTNVVDIDAVGAGGNDVRFVRGSSGGVMQLRGVPFSREDVMYAYVAKALPLTSETWERPAPTWLYMNTKGGFVLTSGTSFGEPGEAKWDQTLQQYILLQGSGQPGTATSAGQGHFGFGFGGFNSRAGDGMIRVRFYTR